MYDTIKISDFDKTGNDYVVDLEVDVSFDLSHNGIENVSIDSIWDVTTDDPKELELKDLTQDEVADLKARLEKEMSEKELEYEHDIYLSQADDTDDAYDDFKNDLG
jgi:hypothetical protein